MAFNRKAYPTWLHRLMHLAQKQGALWPTQCHVCSQWCHDTLCHECELRHLSSHKACLVCALESSQLVCAACLSSPPAWQASASAVNYVDPWRSLIIGYKFHEQPELARFFAKLMLANGYLRELVLQSDHLIPVPLSDERLRLRGFNQSLLLAQRLSPQRCMAQGLLRVRDTPAQAGLSRDMRQANLIHAFAVHPQHVRALNGKHLVLVDDVMTTGNTLQACALALLQAGAAKVSCVTLARAQSGPLSVTD